MTQISEQKHLQTPPIPRGNYRIDNNKESYSGKGQVWLEKLSDGLPTEHYILVNQKRFEQMKANNQIWSYDRTVERWVSPKKEG